LRFSREYAEQINIIAEGSAGGIATSQAHQDERSQKTCSLIFGGKCVSTAATNICHPTLLAAYPTEMWQENKHYCYIYRQ